MNDKSGGVETERLRAQLLEKGQAIERLQSELSAQKQATEQYRTSSEHWQREHSQITRKLGEIRAQRNIAWSVVGLTALVAGFSGKRFRL
jgi:predicted  nucleic acid-binding Zn-ribbon protein